MLRNYIRTAIRNLVRHKFFSLINIFGLAISMSICMAIIMLIADQLMYDRYNTRRDRIFRVNTIPLGGDGEEHTETATTTLPLKQELLERYAGIEKAVRFTRGFANNWIEIDQNVNIPVAGYFADPEALDLFELELEYGDSRTALIEPYSVVLTKKAARKIFRQENPLGETFKVGENGLYKVTGVLKETDHKSHIAFDALASMSTVKSLEALGKREKSADDWYNFTAGWIYVLLEKGKTVEDIRPSLAKIQKEHFTAVPNPDYQQKIKYKLQSLTRITPGAVFGNPIGPFLPWIFVYFFAGLAAIVMLTSCFNFTNLSVARSLTRAREIGVRKVTGAMRWQIFVQFLSESVLVALFSLVLALGMLVFIKPLILQLSFARMLKWDLEINYAVYAVFLAFAVVVGILAGIFPAVVLSGFQPVKVLKGLNTIKLFSNMGLRKALLVAQFTFSLIFILTVITVFSQLQLFMRADHGFNMDNKVVVQLNDTPPDALKNELLKYPNVESVTAASHIPAAGVTKGNNFKKSMEDREWNSLSYYLVDEDYLKNIEVSLVAGRFFSPADGASNRNLIVLNEMALSTFQLGSPAEALGQQLILQADSSKKQIIGVVKNYNHQLLMQKMEPMGLMYDPQRFQVLQVKYSGSFENAGKTVEAAWAKINPAFKVDYKDFAGEVHKIYNILFGDLVSILGVVAALAILISCMGLLGMATYATETRIKEISIRKILGSSSSALVLLLSKGFFGIVLVAIGIAVPAAYVVNNLWLEKLAYHVSVNFSTILLGVFVLILFSVLTVGSQTWRATFVKPVDNLKGE